LVNSFAENLIFPMEWNGMEWNGMEWNGLCNYLTAKVILKFDRKTMLTHKYF
jgi:hypothetical protein